MSRRALGPAALTVLRAVRTTLAASSPTGLSPTGLPLSGLLVACSGGPDSLALAAATVYVSQQMKLPLSAVVVDHRLQPGSAEQAERAAAQLAALGYVDCVVRTAEPGPAGLGPEGAARVSRYAVLDAEAQRQDAVVLLGHTLDDQAETVLLGLARGSGLRSLAGMNARSGRYLRPLLGLRRTCTEQACAEFGLEPWSDPQNADPAFARVRVRDRVLPLLEAELGGQLNEKGEGRVARALARTAELARDDADYLDRQALDLVRRASAEGPDLPTGMRPGSAAARRVASGPSLDERELREAPRALRTRALRSWLLDRGALEVSAEHVWAVEGLVIDWHGQRWSAVPGLRVPRRGGRLFAARPGPVG